MRRAIPVLAVLMMSLAACGDVDSEMPGDSQAPGVADACLPDDPDCEDVGNSNDPQVAGDPTTPPETLGVEEALAAGHIDGGFVLSGYLFVDADGNAVLCSAIAESFPPQCGGASIPVIGEIPGLDDISTASGLRWSENPVELEGTFDGTTFTLR